MDHSRLPIATHPEIFGTPPGYGDASAGFGNTLSGGGHVYAQGNHLLPAMLAVVGWLFGTTAMLKANVAFGAMALFAFFGLARRVVTPPLALLAMTVVAVSMPLAFVSRDTYSEPLALLFLMGGLALLQRAVGSGPGPRLRTRGRRGRDGRSGAHRQRRQPARHHRHGGTHARVLRSAPAAARARLRGRTARRRRGAGRHRLGGRVAAVQRLLPRRATPHPAAHRGRLPPAGAAANRRRGCLAPPRAALAGVPGVTAPGHRAVRHGDRRRRRVSRQPSTVDGRARQVPGLPHRRAAQCRRCPGRQPDLQRADRALARDVPRLAHRRAGHGRVRPAGAPGDPAALARPGRNADHGAGRDAALSRLRADHARSAVGDAAVRAGGSAATRAGRRLHACASCSGNGPGGCERSARSARLPHW